MSRAPYRRVLDVYPRILQFWFFGFSEVYRPSSMVLAVWLVHLTQRVFLRVRARGFQSQYMFSFECFPNSSLKHISQIVFIISDFPFLVPFPPFLELQVVHCRLPLSIFISIFTCSLQAVHLSVQKSIIFYLLQYTVTISLINSPFAVQVLTDHCVLISTLDLWFERVFAKGW